MKYTEAIVEYVDEEVSEIEINAMMIEEVKYERK